MTLTIPGTPTRGWIILIGGGEFSFGETREFDELAIARMPPDKRTIAFLPTASGSNEYATHLGAYFRAIDETLNVVNVPVYRLRDSRREKNLRLLCDAGMVYVGAGVTNNIADATRGTPVVEALVESLQRGAALVAIGAGASVLGTYARDMQTPGGAIEGIGIIGGCAIETGFENGRDTMLRQLVSRPEVRFGIGIPRGCAVAIAPDRTAQILGEGQVEVVRKPS